MLLTDQEISHAIQHGRIAIRPPLAEDHLRPAGIRIHLGPELLRPRAGQIVDLANPCDLDCESIDLRKEPFLLLPGEFVLACTIEAVKTAPGLLMILEGRSTIARLGLTIHNTASVLDSQPGQWFSPVLEIANHGAMTILLRHGTPIGMLCFQAVRTPSSRSRFHGQYRDQVTTRPPNLSNGATCYCG